jgi:hypothetical protein
MGELESPTSSPPDRKREDGGVGKGEMGIEMENFSTRS